MDKIIHEFKIIETDDGFRIEIKGDKERIREMGLFRMMKGFGRMKGGPGWPGHKGHRFQRRWRKYGFGPQFWSDQDTDEAPDDGRDGREPHQPWQYT